MESAIGVVILLAITAVPFLVIVCVLRRGSSGGKVRSLGNRRRSGRDVDLHASTDRFDAARDATQKRRQPRGFAGRIRRLFRRRDR